VPHPARRISLTTATAPTRFYALAAVPTLGDDVARSWVQLLKTGDFWDPRYDSFSVTGEMLNQMVENFGLMGRAVAGDYDHQASFGSTEANGWVEELEVRAEGAELWALVAWLPETAEAIRAGKWRYISPEFAFAQQSETGENLGPALLGFALTNRPFLEGMAEVSLTVSRRLPMEAGTFLFTTREPRVRKETTLMDPKELARALGLPEDTPHAVLLTRARELGDSTRVVLSRDDHAALVARADAGDAAVEQARTEKRDQVIAAAVAAGKLAPALEAPTRLAYDADPDGTTAALDALPVNPAFKAAGLDKEKAQSVVPTQVDSDAPWSERIHALAIQKQQQDPALSYRDAVMAAEVESPRPVAAA